MQKWFNIRCKSTALDELKLQMGSLQFAAQYQQRPAPMDGGIIKWSWFNTYDRPPMRRHEDMLVQSWDTALTVNDGSDWSVCTTWLIQDNKYYLLDVERFKAEFPTVLQKVIQLARHWNPQLVIIEGVGAGKALYQEARRAVGIVVKYSTPKVDKATRMYQESPAIEAGYVYLPSEAP